MGSACESGKVDLADGGLVTASSSSVAGRTEMFARPGKAGTGAERRRTPRTHAREARVNSADWRISPKAEEWLLVLARELGTRCGYGWRAHGCGHRGGPCGHGRGPARRRTR